MYVWIKSGFDHDTNYICEIWFDLITQDRSIFSSQT